MKIKATVGYIKRCIVVFALRPFWRRKWTYSMSPMSPTSGRHLASAVRIMFFEGAGTGLQRKFGCVFTEVHSVQQHSIDKVLN